jgi:hypothetical protein
MVAGLIPGAGPLAAQAAPAADSVALTVRIQNAARIRARLPTGWATLEAPRLRQDTLHFLRGSAHDRGGRAVSLQPPLALGDIAEIQVPAGGQSKKGAAWGAGIGGALGLILAIAATAESDCLGCPTDAEGFVAVPILAALGAGVGALIGAGSTRWQTVYRAP